MDDVSVDDQNLGVKGRTAILDTGQFLRKEPLIIIDCVYDLRHYSDCCTAC